ncbi:MAG: hypothetical protein ABSA86_11210, partial [Oryzomonas sp.]
ALIALGAGNAMASFDNGDLIRFVYNSATGSETGTDLGSISTLLTNVAASGSVNITAPGLFTNGANLGSANNANLMVAYMVANDTYGTNGYNPNTNYFSSQSGQVNGPFANTNMQNQMGALFSGVTYNPVNTHNSTQVSTTNTNAASYQVTMSNGFMGGLLLNPDGEASLATLATASISQSLYYWADVTAGTDGSLVTSNGQALQILTNSNGSTTLVGGTSPTPIPAAAYLLGSGLMGLLGLRRKQKA